MLICLIALLCISALAFVFGTAAVCALGGLVGRDDAPPIAIPITCIIGLVVLGVVAGYLSFVLNMGLVAAAIVLTVAVIVGFGYRHAMGRNTSRLRAGLRSVSLPVWVIFALGCVLVLIEGTASPKDGDSGLYHIQTIKWAESYSVVPGVGNLHGFLALSSMWYPLSALLGVSFLGIEPLHVVNGALYLFALAFFLGGVNEVVKGEPRLTSVVKAASIPFALFLLRPQIGSPATDLPAALLVWIALLLLLDTEALPARAHVATIAAIGLATFAVTVKLAVVPVMLLLSVILYRQLRAGRLAAVAAQLALIALIVVPWLGRHIVQSGYLLYPVAFIDLFSVDWKLPYWYVESERLAVQGWSRLPGPEWSASLHMPLQEWVPRWYAWLPYNYKLAITAAAGLTVGALALIVSRPRLWLEQMRRGHTVTLVYVTAWVGLLYWFLTAPDPRYGFVFLFVALLLPVAGLVRSLVSRYPSAARLTVGVLLPLYVLNHVILSTAYLPQTSDILLSPEPYPSVALETKLIDDHVLYFPIASDRCWYAPLPCMPVLNDGLRLRGSALEGGFRIAD